MINFQQLTRRPAWLTNLMALGLVLASSAMLLYFCRHGPPSRAEMGLLISILLLTPTFLNWRWGWLILFAFFPFGPFIRRLYILYQPGALTNDPLIMLPDMLMALMAFGFILHMRLKKRQPALYAVRPLNIAMILLMALSCIEVFNPAMSNVTAGFNGLRQLTLWMMIYFIVPTVIERREQIYSWIWLTLGVGTVTGLYGAYQYLVEFPYWDQAWAEQQKVTTQAIGDAMRAFSTFTFTSTFSQYMLIAACMATVCMQMRRAGYFTRLLSPFFLSCMLLGLAVTFVRSSYLGLALAWMVGLIVPGTGAKRIKRIFAVLLVGSILVAVVPHKSEEMMAQEVDPSTGQLVADRLQTIMEPTKVGTVSIRTVVWQRILAGSIEYPAGVGLGAGNSSRFGQSVNDYWVAAMAYSESQLFTMLAELGWPGFLLYIFIIVYGLLYSLRVHDALEDAEDRRLVQMMIMLQVGISAAGVSGGPILYTLPGEAYYWGCLGMVCAISRMNNLTEERFKLEAAEAAEAAVAGAKA